MIAAKFNSVLFSERAFPMIVFWKWIQLHCLPKEMQRNTQVNEENFTRSSQNFLDDFSFFYCFSEKRYLLGFMRSQVNILYTSHLSSSR